MDGLFSPQKILKVSNYAARNQVPMEIRLDEDPQLYIGFLVTEAIEHNLHASTIPQDAKYLVQQPMAHMQGWFLSPVEPAFGNARIRQATHVYVQFGMKNCIFRCMLKVIGQHPHDHITLHRLSFPEALLRFSNRGEKRSHLPPETTVTALVRSRHQEVSARVLDVSLHGVAIQFPPGTRLFNREQTLKIDLFVPAIGKISFPGTLKHYSPVLYAGSDGGNFIQCGIEMGRNSQTKKQAKKWRKLLVLASRRERAYHKRQGRGLLSLGRPDADHITSSQRVTGPSLTK